jgi:hypothetical protein
MECAEGFRRRPFLPVSCGLPIRSRHGANHGSPAPLSAARVQRRYDNRLPIARRATAGRGRVNSAEPGIRRPVRRERRTSYGEGRPTDFSRSGVEQCSILANLGLRSKQTQSRQRFVAVSVQTDRHPFDPWLPTALMHQVATTTGTGIFCPEVCGDPRHQG